MTFQYSGNIIVLTVTEDEMYYKRCKYCGNLIDYNAINCPYCGIQNIVLKQADGNAIAIVGFILSFFVTLPGFICSLIGYSKAANNRAPNKGYALAGMVISGISIVIQIILLIYFWTALLSILS